MSYLVATPLANSQEPGPNRTQEMRTGSAGATPSQARDIISDNLEQVAAAANQILEVLNREPGLMVELKRLLAQDAGMPGQILQESDLSDTAVAGRFPRRGVRCEARRG